jgi:hypothetical protein
VAWCAGADSRLGGRRCGWWVVGGWVGRLIVDWEGAERERERERERESERERVLAREREREREKESRLTGRRERCNNC